MEGSLKELSEYRLSRAEDDYMSAELLLDEGKYKASINRSYYSIFHALRAVTALDGFDSSKHSGIIAYINRNYVKTGVFDKKLSKILDTSFRLREKADYQDFFIVAKDDAVNQLAKAEEVIRLIKDYLETIE